MAFILTVLKIITLLIAYKNIYSKPQIKECAMTQTKECVKLNFGFGVKLWSRNSTIWRKKVLYCVMVACSLICFQAAHTPKITTEKLY